MQTQVEQLKAILGHFANSPASEKSLLHAEHTFGVLPADLRLFYRRMDGAREMTPLERGAIRFWPLAEWKFVGQEVPSPLYAASSAMPIVADHMTDCWWYAVDCSASSKTFGAVFLVDGARPAAMVAPTFDLFLDCVLTDAPSLYPST